MSRGARLAALVITRLGHLREALPDVRPVGTVGDRIGAPSLLVRAERTVP